MSGKESKQFGIWLDSHHATVVGREQISEGKFILLGHINNEGPGSNSSEKAANNLERTLRHSFFKDIVKLMPNVDEIFVTGTGDAQEQFTTFLSETPQYKNVKAHEDTANKMSDDKFVEMVSSYFHG